MARLGQDTSFAWLLDTKRVQTDASGVKKALYEAVKAQKNSMEVVNALVSRGVDPTEPLGGVQNLLHAAWWCAVLVHAAWIWF